METRSQWQVVEEDVDSVQGTSDVEVARSGGFTVESPPVSVALNPQATPFPNPESLEDPPLVVLSPLSSECDSPCPDIMDIASEDEDGVTVDLPDPDIDPRLPDYPDVCPDDDTNQDMLGCIYAACTYGTQGDEIGLNPGDLSVCKICEDMFGSEIFICDNCLAEGAHRGHKPWLIRVKQK